MTTATSVPTAPALGALALRESVRFARHPMFLAGAGVLVAMAVTGIARHQVVDVAAVEGTVGPAFLLGVFGFVVAHRLTTSTLASAEVLEVSATRERTRSMALCLACLVPMSAGLVVAALDIVFGAMWPPESSPPGGRVAWFGQEPTLDMIAVLVSTTVLASVGGPLLGVAVGRWAPFRGSALVGVVAICFGVAFLDGFGLPWSALAPWVNFSQSLVVGGEFQESWLNPGLDAAWQTLYTACLCVLAVLAALLHDPQGRRPLLVAGGLVSAAALVSWQLAV